MVSEVVAEEIMGDVNAKTAAIFEKAAAEGTILSPEAFQAQYDEAVHTDFASNAGKLGAAFAALLTNQDVNVAAHVAQNAVENNFIPAALTVGFLAYEAYDIYQTYKNEGAEAAAVQLGFTVGTAVIGGIAVKGAFIMGGVAFRTAAEAITHYKQAHPVFAKFYDIAVAACVKGVNAYKKLDAKLDAAASNVMQKVLPNKGPSAVPAPKLDTPKQEAPKQLRSYVKEIEAHSETPLNPAQRQLLKQDLKQTQYAKLDKPAYLEHIKEFKGKRDSLINQWEQQTGKKWPTYSENIYNSNTGMIIAQKGAKYQAHHIVPQQLGGKHVWWNIHPVPTPAHQKVVHGSEGALNAIIKELGK